MQTQWEGFYLDGRTAARRAVTIHLMPTGLEIVVEGGGRLWWPYGEVRQTQGFYANEPVRLEHGGELAEAILVADAAAFLRALRLVAPNAGRRFHDPTRRRLRTRLTVLAALVVVALGGALYLWGIPALAALAAARVPVAWEERLGQVVIEQLAPMEKRCKDPAGARAIGHILATLARPLGGTPYTFRVTVVDAPQVNAFAAPGGYVVLLRGLLERARSPEEVAGVLAHELQHVVQRHPTRSVFQHASTGLLLAALAGDPTGAAAYGLEAARMLATLRYSRQDETEADREGARMLLAAGVDPAGMIAFLESLEKAEGQSPETLTYLSSHPSPGERVRKLRTLTARAPRTPITLLDDAGWLALRRMCEGMAPPR